MFHDSRTAKYLLKLQAVRTNASIISLITVDDIDEALEGIAKGEINSYLIKGYFDEKLLKKTIAVAKNHKESFAKKNKGSRTEFQMFFFDSPCPMWILEPQTLTFLAVNDAVCKLYGYKKEDFLNMRLPEI